MKHKDTATTSVPTRKVARFGSSSYKFWILLALLLLAFWSMFTLKLFTSNLSRYPDDFPAHGDLDVLEVEEMEKVVRQMWELYTRKGSGRSIGLPRFWREAFEAAYEYLASDVPGVRDDAVSEIAAMSLLSINGIEPLTIKSTVSLHGV